MDSIPSPAQALLGSDAVAHVWTSNPDGSGQVSVVWVIVHDDEILFGTDAKSRKARNLARNPRLIMSIEDEESNERGFQRHLVIHGTATIEPGALAMRDSPTSVIVRVEIERLGGVGPWIDT